MDEAQPKFIIKGLSGMGTPSAGGVWNLLNGVAQGTDYTERIGRVAYMESVDFFFSAEPQTAGSSPTGDVFRIMLVLDTQANASNPTTSDLLDGANYGEFLNENTRERFLVLDERWVHCEANAYAAGALSTGDPKMKTLSYTVPLFFNTYYSGIGSTIASIQTNALWFFCISAYASWKASYNAKVVYYDS